MSENATKPLELAAGIFLTLLALSVGFFILRGSRGIATAVTEKVDSASMTIGETNLMRYNNTVVKGSDVVACIRSNGDKILVNVVKIVNADGTSNAFTVSNVAGANFTLDNFSNLPSNSGTYINPNADFKGSVVRNANGVITQVKFEQARYVDDASFYLADNTVIPPGGSSGDETLSMYAQVLVEMSDGMVDISNQVVAMSDMFESLQRSVQDLAENSNQSSNTNVLESNINALSAKLEDLADKLELFEASVNDGDNSSSIAGQISALNSALEALQATVGSLGDEDNTDTMASTIEALSTTVSEMGEVLQSLVSVVGSIADDDSDNATLLETVSNLESVIGSMQESMNAISETLKQMQEAMTGSSGGSTEEPGGDDTEEPGGGTDLSLLHITN